jgi:hypothetical protein
MSYCTTTELINITGSDLGTTKLQAIIDDADREIDAYLAPYGLSGTASGACKSASLKLSQAGIYLLAGNTAPTEQLFNPAGVLRKAAFTLLDWYIDNQTSLSGSKRVFVRRVDGK